MLYTLLVVLVATANALSLGGAVAPTGQLNGLLARRSVAKYDTAKPVPAEATERALQAAILAPNHFLSEPWRFYTCGPDTKAKLCALKEDRADATKRILPFLIGAW